jgi:hypothetical protein
MKFRRLLEIVGGEPVCETGLLLAGDVDSVNVQRQMIELGLLNEENLWRVLGR